MEAPRLRTDLVAQQVEDAGHHFVDVTDPGNGKTFRFYEAEYFIATAMNGARDLSGLANWAEAELGVSASADELRSVVAKLSELGYLDTTPLGDISLGSAGGAPLADNLPEPARVELGSAGNASVGVPVGIPAPNLSLGSAGNEKIGPLDFGGGDDDEPTKVKGNPLTAGRMSDPSIPPRPPTSQPPTPILTPHRSGSMVDEEGPTNLPAPATEFDDEVSVDLSDHMKLGPDAVKEAVRQSQMLNAVNPDEIDELKTPSDNEKSEGDKAEPEKPAALKPTELPKQPATKPPETKPPETAKPVGPVTPTADDKKSSVSTVVVLLLILVALFAVAVALNLFNLRSTLGLDSKEEATEPAPAPEVKPNTQPETPPPKKPQLPAAKLVEAEGPGIEIKATDKGTLASIVDSGTAVEADAEIARLAGGERFAKSIDNVKLRLDHYQGKLDKAIADQKKAEADGDANNAKRLQKEVEKAQAKVDEKHKKIAEDEEKLAAFVIKAPAAGTVEHQLKAGDRVEADAVVATMKGAPVLSAVFTLPADKTLQDGEEVEVVSKTDDKKRLGCQVTAIEGAKATVECPADEGLSAGADVVLP